MTPPILLDTTLRDGEQSPGIVFRKNDRIRIARMLCAIGVTQIEAGTPIMGPDEEEVIAELIGRNLPARIFTWNRAAIKDIDASLRCGVKNVFVSSPVSDLQIRSKLGKDREWVIAQLLQSIGHAKSRGCYVACGLEDSSRAEPEWLISVIKSLQEGGADRVRIADTVGVFTPVGVYELIKRIKNECSIPIEIHTHNDFGLATANAISAHLAGAEYIDTTLLGIGERAGNAALEEIAMTLKILYKIDTGIDPVKLSRAAGIFSRAFNVPISRWKPFLGENVFTHESGIHVDGVLKNPVNYEPYPPELLGRERRFLIGKHSGSKAIRNRCEELGLKVNEERMEALQLAIRKESERLKGSLSDGDLIAVCKRVGAIS
jgi:homocitrate synthase NifV